MMIDKLLPPELFNLLLSYALHNAKPRLTVY